MVHAYVLVGLILGILSGLPCGIGLTLLIQRWRWVIVHDAQTSAAIGVPLRQWTDVTYHRVTGTLGVHRMPTRGLKPELREPFAADGILYYAEIPEDRSGLTTLHYYPTRHGPARESA